MKYTLAALLVVVVGCASAPITPADAVEQAKQQKAARELRQKCTDPPKCKIVELANKARDAHGLDPLFYSDKLARAAQGHANEMCAHNYVSHTSLDGRTMKDRIDAQHVKYTAIGENIAQGTDTPQETHNAWMKSPHHRDNILREEFHRIGVGHTVCGGKELWVQDFAD